MSVDIRDRLADLEIEIAPDTAQRHRAAIEAELKSPSPIPVRRMRRRRRPTVILAIVALVVLTAAGALAETAVQGEPLYPVKQVTEWARTWIDATVPADHRIEELDRMIDRRANQEEITDQLQRAEDAVADVADRDAVLVDRLDRARDRIVDVEADAPNSDQPVVDDPPQSDGTDRPPESTLPPTERPGDGDESEQDGQGDALEGGEGDLGLPAALPPLCRGAAASIERGETIPRWVLRACRDYLPQHGDRASDSP